MLLSRKVIDEKKGALAKHAFASDYPERVIQIGEGNFLRGFVDWMIHQLNKNGLFKGRVVVVAPRPSGHANVKKINDQNGFYTTLLRGIYHSKEVHELEVVSSISRSIDPYENWEDFLKCAENPNIDICVSNTTESGIVYTKENYMAHQPVYSFPGKLTAYLYHRFQHFHGSKHAGLTVLPCELVEHNGDLLKSIVLQHADDWGLPADFKIWLQACNHFCNTLVDRIVTGYPTEKERAELFDQLGYEDLLLTIGEPFHQWVIEGAEGLESRWPFAEIGLNVKYVDDLSPYRIQKVRLLNGAHTGLAYLAYFLGLKTVGESIRDPLFGQFVREIIYEEIVPVVSRELPTISVEAILSFGASVIERFENPFLEHRVIDLTLNGLSKVKSRLLPTFAGYVSIYGSVPARLTLAFAAFLLFYKNQDTNENQWSIRDDPDMVAQIQTAWAAESEKGLNAAIQAILGLENIWGKDLNQVTGFCEALSCKIRELRQFGPQNVIDQLNQKLQKSS